MRSELAKGAPRMKRLVYEDVQGAVHEFRRSIFYMELR